MAEFGPHDSTREEGFGVLLFAGGLAMWVAGLAYASPVLQVILVIAGVAMNIASLVIFHQAKVAGDAARKAAL